MDRTVKRGVLGGILGIVLLLVGGITWQPPDPRCADCYVLNADLAHYCPGAQAVVGGIVC